MAFTYFNQLGFSILSIIFLWSFMSFPLSMNIIEHGVDNAFEVWPTFSSTICGGWSQIIVSGMAWCNGPFHFAAFCILLHSIRAPECTTIKFNFWAQYPDRICNVFIVLFICYYSGLVGVACVATTNGDGCNTAADDGLHIMFAAIGFVSYATFCVFFCCVFDKSSWNTRRFKYLIFFTVMLVLFLVLFAATETPVFEWIAGVSMCCAHTVFVRLLIDTAGLPNRLYIRANQL